MYPVIDYVKTGKKLKRVLKQAGYCVKDIQEYLHFECPQPIYRWYKGIALPTVNHLYALSVLLDLPIEELLVVNHVFWDLECCSEERIKARCKSYYMRMEVREEVLD